MSSGVRFSLFLKHIPSITTKTLWHITYQLNNTNGEYDITNPLVTPFFDYLYTLEETPFPFHWYKFPEQFLPILDLSQPINLNTFSASHLIQLFSYSEVETILYTFTNLIAPEIEHFPQSFLNTKPPIATHVSRFF